MLLEAWRSKIYGESKDFNNKKKRHSKSTICGILLPNFTKKTQVHYFHPFQKRKSKELRVPDDNCGLSFLARKGRTSKGCKLDAFTYRVAACRMGEIIQSKSVFFVGKMLENNKRTKGIKGFWVFDAFALSWNHWSLVTWYISPNLSDATTTQGSTNHPLFDLIARRGEGLWLSDGENHATRMSNTSLQNDCWQPVICKALKEHVDDKPSMIPLDTIDNIKPSCSTSGTNTVSWNNIGVWYHLPQWFTAHQR